MRETQLNLLFELDRLASSLAVIADAAKACTYTGPDSVFFAQEVPLAIEDARSALETLHAQLQDMKALITDAKMSELPALRLASERG